MNRITLIVIAAALGLLFTACGKQESPAPVSASTIPSDLTDVLKRCRQNRAAVGEEACRAAQDEYRRRFMTPGKSPYESKVNPATTDASGSPASTPSKDVR